MDLGDDYLAVQYGPPGLDDTIDIASRLGEAFRFEDLEPDTVRLRDRNDAQRLARASGFDRDEGA